MSNNTIDYESADIKAAIRKYKQQRNQAMQRGVDWLITFEEWWDWWQSSGHWHQRGCKSNSYVMARYNDTGPYKIGNIKCITHKENLKEYHSTQRHSSIMKAARNSACSTLPASPNQQPPRCVPDGIPVPAIAPKKVKQKFSDLPADEQHKIRSERSKAAAMTRIAEGTQANTGRRKGTKLNDTSNYKGRVPWNKGKKTGPRPAEVVEKVRAAVIEAKRGSNDE